ncbi:hypothetical protein PV325_003354 [Microctonus aethiopoides]|nr:hypothetical protein PV325_003354 [Microctonus aethiopoides]
MPKSTYNCGILVNDNHTDIVLKVYSNRLFLIVTQFEKLGSLVTVNRGSPINQFDSDIYTAQTIFGNDSEEIHAAARYIAESIKIDRPLKLILSIMSLIFGQLVIGPPGSGKTTYCNAMSNFLEKMGRKIAIINIDPANENMEYKATVDITELIKHDEVMNTYSLGPNGALVYCMEFLEANTDWLIKKILDLKDHYIIIDCPGQIELYTHHKSITKIVERMSENLIRLCSVHLMDSHHCSDPGKYLSSLMVCTSTMLQIGLPHINIMTKLDLMQKYKDKLDFNIEFYTEVLDLNYLLERLDEDPITAKYKKLNAALVSLIQDYSLVSFLPLDISNQALLLQVKNAIDKANGYIFGGNEPHDIQTLLACAVGAVNEKEKMSTLDSYFQ